MGWRRTGWAWLAATAAAGLLVGCAVPEGGSSSGAGSASRGQAASSRAESVPGYEPQQGLSNSERFALAIRQLERGAFEAAEIELETYLDRVPRSRRAALLLEQLNADPIDLLGETAFDYELGNGESLSVVAQKFLGEPLLFVALARYNGIEKPNRVVVGQKLVIPGEEPEPAPGGDASPDPMADAEPAAEQIDPGMATPPPEVAQTLQAFEDDAAEAQTEAMVETVDAEAVDAAAPASAAELVAAARSTLADDAAGEAVALLRDGRERFPEAEAIDPLLRTAYRAHGRSLAPTEPDRASAFYQSAGELALAAGDRRAALDDFRQAQALNPENSEAGEQAVVLQEQLTSELFQQATVAFQRQDLDQAIALWQEVLEINPDHTDAQLQLSRARQMQERFKRLKMRGEDAG